MLKIIPGVATGESARIVLVVVTIMIVTKIKTFPNLSVVFCKMYILQCTTLHYVSVLCLGHIISSFKNLVNELLLTLVVLLYSAGCPRCCHTPNLPCRYVYAWCVPVVHSGTQKWCVATLAVLHAFRA